MRQKRYAEAYLKLDQPLYEAERMASLAGYLMDSVFDYARKCPAVTVPEGYVLIPVSALRLVDYAVTEAIVKIREAHVAYTAPDCKPAGAA